MLSQFLIFFGIAINAIGTFGYLIQTIKGKIKPNKVTYFVWSLAPFIAFLAQLQKHVGVASFMTLSVSIFPLSIFIGSFFNKKAHWKVTAQDLFCGALSILGLVLWYKTGEGNIAILFSLFSESLATLPTIIKSYFHPETESAWPWLASVISGLFTLVTLSHWTFANSSFAVLYTFEMTIIFVLVRFKIGKKKN